jgi:hypothetical protein
LVTIMIFTDRTINRNNQNEYMLKEMIRMRRFFVLDHI